MYKLDNFHLNEIMKEQKYFNKDEWIDVLIRSTGESEGRLRLAMTTKLIL